MFKLIYFLALIPFIFCQVSIDPQPILDGYFSLNPISKDIPQMSLHYKFYTDVDNIDYIDILVVSQNTNGWVGIGFGKTLSMDDADILVCSQNLQGYYSEDRYSPVGYGVPPLDSAYMGTNDITGFGSIRVTEINGEVTTYCRFQRKLNTGDTSNKDVVITKTSPIKFIAAMNPTTDTFLTHTFRTAVEVFNGVAIVQKEKFQYQINPKPNTLGWNTAPIAKKPPLITAFWRVFNGGSIEQPNEIFDILVVSKRTTGWVGWGVGLIGKGMKMSYADMHVCRDVNGKFIAEDRKIPSTFQVAPSLDSGLGASDDILGFGSLVERQVDGSFTTYCRFQRKLNTGDLIGDREIQKGLAFQLLLGAHQFSHDFSLIHTKGYTRIFPVTVINSVLPVEAIPTPAPVKTNLDVSPSVYSTFNVAPNQVSTPDIDFYWTTFNDGVTNIFDAVIVSRNTNGWVSFGISPHDKMDGSDLYVCRMQSNTIIAEDRIANGYGTLLDSSNDILNFGMSRYPETDGSTTTVCRIQRKLVTNDPNDLPIFQNTNVANILVANSQSDEFIMHSTRSSFTINSI